MLVMMIFACHVVSFGQEKQLVNAGGDIYSLFKLGSQSETAPVFQAIWNVSVSIVQTQTYVYGTNLQFTFQSCFY